MPHPLLHITAHSGLHVAALRLIYMSHFAFISTTRPWPTLSPSTATTTLFFKLTPSPPNPSLLAAPLGRLIASVPGGGDHATFLIWLSLLQIKATSLHLSTPSLQALGLYQIVPLFFAILFYFFNFLQFKFCFLLCKRIQFKNDRFLYVWIEWRQKNAWKGWGERGIMPSLTMGFTFKRGSIFMNCTWGPRWVCLSVYVHTCVSINRASRPATEAGSWRTKTLRYWWYHKKYFIRSPSLWFGEFSACRRKKKEVCTKFPLMCECVGFNEAASVSVNASQI